MAVTINSTHVVKPAKPTWNGILPLSELDQAGFITHTPFIYIYKKPSQNILRNEIFETIKDSLSHILVPYYPLAGRLREVGNGTGRAELECNAMGALLIEAESRKQISDFGDFSSSYEDMFHGLVPNVDYKLPMQELPVFLVQVTWFQCGGFSIGMLFSHMIADGQSIFHFVQEWAKLVRGQEFSSPYLDRGNLHGGHHDLPLGETNPKVDGFVGLPTLIGARSDLEERQKEVVSKTFVLSKTHIESLLSKAADQGKLKTNEESKHANFPHTRYEVIACHIWKCACKARGLSNEQETALCFLVNSRTILNPPLPPSYLGDAVVIGVVTSHAGELMSTPLPNVCQKLRAKKKETMSDNYVRSTIKFYKGQETLFKCQERAAFGDHEGLFFGNPNILVTSLLNFPTRDLDFGWGNEIYMGTATQQFDGDILIFPGYHNDRSVVVSVGLQAEHMEKFSKSLYMDIN